MRAPAFLTALLAGAAIAAPAGAATPPPAGAAHHSDLVVHAAPTSGSSLALAPDALAPVAPSPAPSLGDPASSQNLTPAPRWVPRVRQDLQARKYANWSGYADDASPGSYFGYTYSQWTVPHFTCAAPLARNGSQTSQWIGIDGSAATDRALEQAGTIEGCGPHGKPYVMFFWEMIPQLPHQYLEGHPGDTIEASVSYLGNNEFQLIVIDTTTNQTLNVTEPCAASSCSLASSEAITEWPGSQLKSGITLTRYGTFSFYDYYATNYVPATGLTYEAVLAPSTLWTSSAVETVGPKPHGEGSRIVQAPSAPFDDDRAFYQQWRYAF